MQRGRRACCYEDFEKARRSTLDDQSQCVTGPKEPIQKIRFHKQGGRACSVIEVPRMTVRYRSRRPDDLKLRERLPTLTHERRRFLHLRRRGLQPDPNTEAAGGLAAMTALANCRSSAAGGSSRPIYGIAPISTWSDPRRSPRPCARLLHQPASRKQ